MRMVAGISEQGRLFLAYDEATLRKLDDIEGMLQLLELLAGREQAKRADLLPEWQAFLHQHSKFASPVRLKQRSMPGFTIWLSANLLLVKA